MGPPRVANTCGSTRIPGRVATDSLEPAAAQAPAGELASHSQVQQGLPSSAILLQRVAPKPLPQNNRGAMINSWKLGPRPCAFLRPI